MTQNGIALKGLENKNAETPAPALWTSLLKYEIFSEISLDSLGQI